MSLGTMTRSLMKGAKKRFPGASDVDLRHFVLLQESTALENLTLKDDELAKLGDAAFSEAVETGQDWAVALKNSYRDNVVKPLVDKAKAADVDPVPVVIVETGRSADEVRAMIEELENDFLAELETSIDSDENSVTAPVATAY